MKVKPEHLFSGTLLVVAAGIALVAYKGTGGQIGLTKYVELHRGPLQEHLVSTDELNMGRIQGSPKWPLHYPATVAAGITGLVKNGFTPLYKIPEPQAAALPAEQAW